MTFLGILHYEIKEMIQKIQMIQKETQQMNGDLLRLGTLTSNSPVVDEEIANPSRPTNLPGPVNTLVSANYSAHEHGCAAPTITTTQHSALFCLEITLCCQRCVYSQKVCTISPFMS